MMRFLIFPVVAIACARPIVRPIAAAEEFSGVFTESYRESIFFPCGRIAGEQGWWVRFKPGVKADRARYQYDGSGFPNSTHFVRLRGTLSGPGHYGTGFHTRELVVDSVLEVRDPKGCETALDIKPVPWRGAGSFGRAASAATISRDGQLSAVADSRGMLRVWETRTARLVAEFRYADPYAKGFTPSTAISFSPTGYYIAVGRQDGVARVWAVQQREHVRDFAHSAGEDTVGRAGEIGWAIYGVFHVNSVAFGPGETTLVTSGGGRGTIWSLETGRKIGQLLGQGSHRNIPPANIAVAYNPDRILGYASDGTLRVYSPAGGPPLSVIAAPKRNRLEGLLALSPDERFIALRSHEDSVVVWSAHEGRFTSRIGVPPFFWGGVAFSADGKMIALSGGSFSVYVWDTESGAPLGRVNAPHSGARSLWFTSRGDSIVMSSVWDSTLMVSPLVFPRPRAGRVSGTQSIVPTPPTRTSAHIYGLVTDATRPIQFGEVSLFRDSLFRARIGRPVLSDADGLFEIDSLDPGPVYLRARRIGYNMIRRKVSLVPAVNSITVVMNSDPMRLSEPLPVF